LLGIYATSTPNQHVSDETNNKGLSFITNAVLKFVICSG